MGAQHQIGMLWMRGSLSFLEQLCVQSFLDAGHHVVLYEYDHVERVPEGVERRNAADILSEDGFLTHARTGSPALHSDLFRYRLLDREPGMIWADTDAYCRRPFETATGHFHGWESAHHVNGGVLGLPKDSDTLGALLEFTRDEFAVPAWYDEKIARPIREAAARGEPVHVSEQPWGVWGPHAITHFLKETGEIRHALPQVALYPYSFKDRRRMLFEGRDHSEVITDETFSIHLYGRRMRKRMAERDHGLPHPDSLMGHLLKKHGIDPCEAPLADWPNPDRDHAFAKDYRAAAAKKRPRTAAAPAQEVRPLNDVVAITTMKNEGPYILDWVAYHRQVGITHFLVYTNDCDDQTNAILDRLGEKGLVTRVDNPVQPGERPQRVALTLAGQHPRVRQADAWVVMDVDEYMAIHTGRGRLADLFAACGDPDLISMTWRFFGHAGRRAIEDVPVPLQFTRCAPERVRKPHQNWGFKTIVRREAPFARIGVHRPLEPTGPMPRWTNGSGEQMGDSYLDDGWRSNVDSVGYELVTLNHYATRSIDSFLVKRDRGRTNHINRDQGIDYWQLHDRNDEHDPRLADAWPEFEAGRAELLADSVLAQLHQDAVGWHRRRADDLRQEPEYAALSAWITGDPLTPEMETALQPPAAEPVEEVTTRPVEKATAPEGDPIHLGEADDIAFAALLDRVQPRFPPLSPAPAPLPHDEIVVVTAMKNEGPFILDWIAHHLSIGVTHFLVYTNDCDDQTDAILDRLADLGHVTRCDNPFNREAGQKPQRGALNDAASHPRVTGADWVGVIDVDEFVNIHAGDGTLPDLFRRMNDPNVVSMTWRLFGNGGVTAYEDRPVTEQFTRCAPRYLPRPRLGWGFKSFVHRSAPFGKLGVHRPLDLDDARLGELRWVNGSGRRMPEKTIQNSAWFSRKASIGYGMVTLNHYILRSAESFLVKRERGRINHVDQDQGVEYWQDRNYATETDTSILRHAPAAAARRAELLADETLAGLHLAAVAWHRERIAALKQVPEYRALYDRLIDPHQLDAVFTARTRPEADENAEERVPEEA